MYIVCFYDYGVHEIVCQAKSLRWIANTLEKKQLRYTVSSSEVKLKQEHFGYSGYEYWVQHLFED